MTRTFNADGIGSQFKLDGDRLFRRRGCSDDGERGVMILDGERKASFDNRSMLIGFGHIIPYVCTKVPKDLGEKTFGTGFDPIHRMIRFHDDYYMLSLVTGQYVEYG